MGPNPSGQVAQGGAAEKPPQPPRHPIWQQHRHEQKDHIARILDFRTLVDDYWVQVVLVEYDLDHHLWQWAGTQKRFETELYDITRDILVRNLYTDDVSEAYALFEELKARAPEHLMEDAL